MEYEYKCSCGEVLTIARSIMAEEMSPLCPLCNQPMWRVYTPPMIDYKGEGWTGAGQG